MARRGARRMTNVLALPTGTELVGDFKIERMLGAGLLLGSGLALLVLGRLGVDDADRTGTFVPTALRGTLTASLVMALADAQTLLLFGGVAIHDASDRSSEITSNAGVLLVGAGVLLILAGWGLFRLRGWGVLASVLGNLALLGVVVANVGDLPQPLRLGWGTTAAVQLLLMARLLIALRTGAPASPRRLPTSTAWITTLVVLALVLTGLVCAAFDIQLIGVR